MTEQKASTQLWRPLFFEELLPDQGVFFSDPAVFFASNGSCA